VSPVHLGASVHRFVTERTLSPQRPLRRMKASQAEALAIRLTDSQQVVVGFEHDLMEQTIRCGWARVTYERITVSAEPPDSAGRASLRVEADGDMTLQLIEEPLPSDVAMDLATGRWTSAVVERVS